MSEARGRAWSRILLVPTLVVPPLWLGGVKPQLIPIFVVLVLALVLRRCWRTSEPLRVPAFWWLGALAALATLLQWLPLPSGLLDVIAPGLRAELGTLLAGTSVEPWPRLSIQPGQTGLELARLLALTGLFVATAQLSWRMVASYVAATGALVALIGLAHQLVGARAIFGVYLPRQDIPGLLAGVHEHAPLVGTFVNPNHQSALLLVAMFAGCAVALDLRARADESPHARERERLADRSVLAWGAVAIQVCALLLSLSRAAIVAFMLVAPLAAGLALRERGRGHGHEGDRRAWRAGLMALLLAALALVFALILASGAAEQLASLRDLDAFRQKYRVARESLALIELSPLLGIGRGCFVDLFPLVERHPGPLQFTHLELTPLAWIVEWGPLVGVTLVLGCAAWLIQTWRSNTSATRRIALCGLLALAIQSCADFSLDFLGVAAPTVALAGALGVGRHGAAWPVARVRSIALIMAAFAAATALHSIPSSWSSRRARDQAIADAEIPSRLVVELIEDALRETPCDPFVHLAAARVLADAGNWPATLQRAEAAARLRPLAVEAHLLAALALARLEREDEARERVRAALLVVPDPVPPPLLDYLLVLLPTPEQLLSVAPIDQADLGGPRRPAWQILARALLERAPAHARALASARARTYPDDPEPLRLQVQLALLGDNPGLALHHARLLVALRPREAASHRLRAQARFAFGEREQNDVAITELEHTLAELRVDDPGSLEELLVRALLQRGDPDSLARAERVMQSLHGRKAERETKQRRQALAEQLERARGQAK